MFKGYKNKDARKEYLKRWRERNRERIRVYFRSYIKGARGYTSSVNLEASSNCSTGRKFELEALKILKDSEDQNKDSFTGKYDLLWRGKKIEVKSKLENQKCFLFNIRNIGIPDYYLLFCRNKDESINKILLVPGAEVKKSSLYIKIQDDIFDKYKIESSRELMS